MNIIYFNPDELRADVLGCYGHPLVKTPNIDRFAARSTTFENCFVQHTVCTPSRCSFLTGWYPHVRGHRSLWHMLQPDEPNTLKYLKQHGHSVHLMGKNDALATETFADSVDEIHLPTQPSAYGQRLHDQPDHAGYMNFLYAPLDGPPRDYYDTQSAVGLLEKWKQGDKPLMLFITLSYPHCPYTCPEPWYSMYDPADIPPLLERRLVNAPSYHRWIRHHRRLDERPQDIKKIMAVYLGMVSYLDHLFGQVMDTLAQSAAADCTTTFFFSDHGDWPGHRGLVEKWVNALDDDLTRVPLIINTPGGVAGHRVKECVELFDIVPTTADLAGYELKHSQFGRSLVPQLQGQAGDAERAVFAEGGYDAPVDFAAFESFGGHKGQKGFSENYLPSPQGIYTPKFQQQMDHPESACRAIMLRTQRWKLIRRTLDVSELYDLQNDPTESVNLIDEPAHSRVLATLNERMLQWLMSTSDVLPWGRDERGWPERLKY